MYKWNVFTGKPDSVTDVSGYVDGPVSSTPNAIAKWSGSDGDALLDSGVIIDNSDNITGITSLTIDPSGDSDANLINVAVTGTPRFAWDESEDRFRLTKGLSIEDGSLTLINPLSPGNGGTQQSAVATGDLLYGSAVDTWSRLGAGTNLDYLSLSGGVPSWQTPGPTNQHTGQTSYASGDILYASAANTLSKLAKGTDGHVLTLASGLPSWAAAAGGSLVLLDSQTASSSSTLELDNTVITSSYDTYMIVWNAMIPSATLAPYLRVSTDNGSTWKNSPGNYSYSHYWPDGSGTWNYDVTTGGAISIPGFSRSTTFKYTMIMFMFDPLNTSCYTSFIYLMYGNYYGSGALYGSANRSAAEADNAIQFSTASGTYESGTMRTYGLAIS